MPQFTDQPQCHDWVLLAQTIQTRTLFKWRPGMSYYDKEGRGPYLLTPREVVIANAGGLPKGAYVALNEWGTVGHLLYMLSCAVSIGDVDRLPPEKAATFGHVMAAILSEDVPGRAAAELLNRAWRKWRQARERGKA